MEKNEHVTVWPAKLHITEPTMDIDLTARYAGEWVRERVRELGKERGKVGRVGTLTLSVEGTIIRPSLDATLPEDAAAADD